MKLRHTAFNRTSVELKPVSETVSETVGVPFNRTSVELKHENLVQVGTIADAFNRTSVELKLHIL